ncbi:MAG: hypothetical protein ABH835_02895 [Patescibacteria group bacterium]|nr:hypothetical protein [Patescibacteria group bacterium]
MRKFKCEKCNQIFDAKGEKIEKQNQIYGPTWYWQAKHECGEQCQEYIPPKVKTKSKSKGLSCMGDCASCPHQGH